MRPVQGLALCAALLAFSGCSGAFWGGTGTGVGGTAAAYEARGHQQWNKVEEDYKAGRIDQREYEIRKDQIRKITLIH